MTHADHDVQPVSLPTSRQLVRRVANLSSSRRPERSITAVSMGESSPSAPNGTASESHSSSLQPAVSFQN